MEQNVKKNILNLGCGFAKMDEFINVDAYPVCNPDVLWDLNKTPWPWEDNSIDQIFAFHIFEHLHDWWGAFTECGRVLRVGGTLEVRVPDESSGTALTYRDHLSVFGLNSFHGSTSESAGRSGTNAWAATHLHEVPLKMYDYNQVPFSVYDWMTRWPFLWLLRFCAGHMRNFIWEQRFYFVRTDREE